MPAHLIRSVTCNKQVTRVAEAMTPCIASPFSLGKIEPQTGVSDEGDESYNFVRLRSHHLTRGFYVKVYILFILKNENICTRTHTWTICTTLG